MKTLQLNNLTSTSFEAWLVEAAQTPASRLCVTCSGYEQRSTHWMRIVGDSLAKAGTARFFPIGFEDYTDCLSRPDNDEFYRSRGCEIYACGSSRDDQFQTAFEAVLQETIATAQGIPVEVHIDYSCMPRRWYCAIPTLVEGILRKTDRAFFWYSPGDYPKTEYPTAGTSDFCVFSGRPSLSCVSRTHLFGLGFDRIRSQAIWSVLDPSNLICFYADPAAAEAYVERVRSDNREVIAASQHCFSVPLDDFYRALSKIVSVVKQFRNAGDVIIVPDGPKPLILASSLVPFILYDSPGVVCFHVARRTGKDFTPVDVKARGNPLGFSFNGNL